MSTERFWRTPLAVCGRAGGRLMRRRRGCRRGGGLVVSRLSDRIAGEQAALRRMATLVARAATPEELFAAVVEEAGRLLGARHAWMTRYEPDGAARLVATWSSTGAAVPAGTRLSPGGRNVSALVFQTGRPARIDGFTGTPGLVADLAREFGYGAAVGVPVSVEGRLWGVMVVASSRGESL